MGVRQEECDQKIYVNGSGISLGHPIAATGAMRLVILLHEMKRRGAQCILSLAAFSSAMVY
jgi:acetyl-CoA C-acetyltransferase